ncbi:MAG: efflux RND transporter periplasmic adaptor subunit [Desulfobacteraceae bacterium]|nr:efflux RND transporter periplasmic adaptor subunit [Desulfobacteraceae bacterium]
MRATLSRRPALVFFALAFILISGGCKEENTFVEPPPPSVTVAPPVQRDAVEYLEFTGTTQSIASVDIRARVQGFLQSVHFKEGAVVKKGDLLYVIDPATYQAAVDKAAGDLASRKAQFDRAEVEYQRNLRLIKENATSERELNNAKGARDAAKADVMVATANLETASINLGYTTIKSPLNGRIGRNKVDAGNLVGAGEFTLLTTIKQYDPIYAYFTLNEHDLLRVMKMDRRDYAKNAQDTPAVIHMGLANEEDFPHEGFIDFADLGVDQSTGTMLCRGVFKNPFPPVIIPGLFVRLRAPLDLAEKALMVTERAIGVDQLGKFVLVVNKDNVVEYRPVKVGVLEDGMRQITEGIKADDRIVVNGVQRARPGAKVNPVAAEPIKPASKASPDNSASPAKP